MNQTSTEHDKVLAKVRALLAKAESTPYPEEAAALTAKANELIAAYAIDLALVEEKTGRGNIESKMFFIDAPYTKQKFLLLSAAAQANNCRAIMGLGEKGYRILTAEDRLDELDASGDFAWLVGYRSDVESVELLFTSLLLQAVRVMVDQGSITDYSGTNRTKSFRRSFLMGFAHTVGRRLTESTRAVVAAANETHGGSLLPVLASRGEAVDDEVAEIFPQVGDLRISSSNYDGEREGRSAGKRADIGSTRLASAPEALQ